MHLKFFQAIAVGVILQTDLQSATVSAVQIRPDQASISESDSDTLNLSQKSHVIKSIDKLINEDDKSDSIQAQASSEQT